LKITDIEYVQRWIIFPERCLIILLFCLKKKFLPNQDFEKLHNDESVAGKMLSLYWETSSGYCIYFDRKRRSHPDFRRKLREKRKAAARSGAGSSGFAMPDLSDGEAVQRFFLQVLCLWPPETGSS
jgi:hypothetical protein